VMKYLKEDRTQYMSHTDTSCTSHDYSRIQISIHCTVMNCAWVMFEVLIVFEKHYNLLLQTQHVAYEYDIEPTSNFTISVNYGTQTYNNCQEKEEHVPETIPNKLCALDQTLFHPQVIETPIE
ncbi:hypothetical protein ACJX0J_024026, partial [Zea mays]